MNRGRHTVGTPAVLLLCLVFAGSLLLTLAYGVRAYRAAAAEADTAYERRTGLGYISQKVRAYDCAEGPEAGAFGAGDALCFYEEAQGTRYETILYVYDGWLRELYCVAGLDVVPAAGDRLAPAQALAVEARDGALTVRLTGTDGRTAERVLTVRAGGRT